MHTHTTRPTKSRTLALACAVLANALVLGGTLGLFNTVPEDAMLARAKTNTAPAATAMAEPAAPAKARS